MSGAGGLVEIALADGVLTLRMNRPDKKNALTRAMYTEMSDALEAADDDPAIAASLFLGVPGAFSAGNDIGDFIEMAEGGGGAMEVARFLRALATARKPLVAAVDGLAIGIGTTMLMHCDLAYASAASVFRTPFLDLGLTPEAGSSLIAPRLMGNQRAFALLALGETWDARAAREAGLIYAIAEDVEARAMDAARRLARKPPEALRIARELLRGDRAAIIERIDLELDHFARRLRSAEARAAFQAFLRR